MTGANGSPGRRDLDLTSATRSTSGTGRSVDELQSVLDATRVPRK
ncbi:MAG TPA: hypothetical protein VE198_04780 [Actinoallomurus sp.]|nr:hypothetical protein [Actinoallomurus sp.]